MNEVRDKWNYAAVMGVLVVLIMNGVAFFALYTERIDWEGYTSYMGTLNGIVLGWISYQITGSKKPEAG